METILRVLDLLDKHNGAVTAIATVLLALLTALYVYLTRRMVQELQRSRQPFVTLDFELPEPLLRLSISNLGQSPARNIRFAIVQDVSWLKGLDNENGLSGIPAIKNGISHLAPGRSLKFYVGAFHGVPKGKASSVSVEISFDDENGNSHKRSETYDIAQLHDVLLESFQNPNQKVVKAIEGLKSSRSGSIIGQMIQKRCPSCAENIPRDAKKCSRCHERIDCKTDAA